MNSTLHDGPPGGSSTASPVPRFLDESKALACIHCGLCLGSCPTYLETGNENDSPRGRIYLMRALQDGRLPLGETATRHLDLCLGCRACEAVCPSGVQYGALLEHARDHLEHHHSRGFLQTFLRRVLIEQVFPHPARLKAALLPLKIIRALRMEFLMPAKLREMAALIPRDASSGEIPTRSPASSDAAPAGAAGRRVGFIRGCVMPVLFGDTNRNSVELLNRAGFEVLAPTGQGCCGALYAHSGQLEKARECARQNIAAFESESIECIVVNAAGCGSTLKEYGALLADDAAWAERARQFGARVRDISEVLPAGGSDGAAGSTSTERVTYHDACHLAHAQRITRQPRDLVRELAGAGFVELPEADLCCGSAGTYNLTEPEMVSRLQSRKVENILRTKADVVVTSNPGCLLQIRAGLDAAGASHVRVMHLADYLASRRRSGRSGQ